VHGRESTDASGAVRRIEEQIIPFGDGVLVTMRSSTSAA
jgi:hypothetical protein